MPAAGYVLGHVHRRLVADHLPVELLVMLIWPAALKRFECINHRLAAE
jgi:hypothetical protein